MHNNEEYADKVEYVSFEMLPTPNMTQISDNTIFLGFESK